jgi:hypothetical protein
LWVWGTDLKKAIIESSLIIKITRLVKIREKAFFAIMRQTGLTPRAIRRLKVKNLEPNMTIPRKINIQREPRQGTSEKPPIFIGEEANRYLTQYLATRLSSTRESLLFSAKYNPNKEINTKNVSREFRRALEKIEKKNKHRYGLKNGITEKSVKKKFTLFSLIEFYREKAKPYLSEMEKNPDEDEEYYRKMYEEKALPLLEIESPNTYTIIPTKQYNREILKRDSQIKEMKQTIARDSEYISSILSLLYSNRGNPETHENEEIGDRFIELWKEVSELQLKNLRDVWQSEGRIKLLPMLDIVEELTKTLKRIKKPYDKLERKITRDSIKDMG